MASLAVTGSVYLPSGARLRASGTTTVAPKMLVGSDYKPIDNTRYPHLQYVRMFAGNNLPDLAAVPAGAVAHPSVAALPSDAALNAYWTKWATGPKPLWFTYKHEVNTGKKGTAAQFQADMHHIIALRNTHPCRDRIKIAVILGLYQQVHNVAGDWTVWMGDLGPLIDAVGWDCYIPVGAATFPDPATFFAPAVASARACGLPLIISELGLTPPVAGETYGPKTTAWFKAAHDYLAGLTTPVCLVVSVWDNPETSQSQVLVGATLTEWQQIMAAQ